MTDVLILHAMLTGTSPADHAAALLARLPYARRLELERRDDAARVASLAGVVLALAGAARLRGHPMDVAQLRFADGGKPAITGGPWFSISHSASRVAVALSERSEVGLDLEEAAAGEPRDATGVARLARWTATEAALKAVGAGLRAAGDLRLSDDLSMARIAGAVITLRPVALGEGCVACLATREKVDGVTIEQVRVPWPCAAPVAT